MKFFVEMENGVTVFNGTQTACEEFMMNEFRRLVGADGFMSETFLLMSEDADGNISVVDIL